MSRMLPVEPRHCETCGVTIGRSRDTVSGKLESWTVYARRRFCSVSCASRWNNRRRQPRRIGPCAQCDRPIWAKGLCQMHYNREWRKTL